ncbi:RDD family protein [Nocardioides daeguensis]|uniref:RDD domain-containing protein n=1 Tax=Nocardioides daeguensis TaxID=908359 RepID=A0ABP6UZ49_9ACTN|nr:RDD family protein [Nocardioides daeguensis]MBV6725961.1 RDD family protein [Nocardioides daeguensis]MCR1772523.1 RDD family protein [Nocardioides daeguensis]
MTPSEPGLFSRVAGAVTGKVVDAVPVEEILGHVDIDAVLDQIDVNHLLDRIDVDRLLDRVDIDRLLARADVEALVQRSGIPDVVAETTSHLAGRTLDVARSQVTGLDTVAARVVDRVLRRRGPAPLGPDLLMDGEGGATVTGRYAGAVSRAAALAVDVGVVLASYSIGVGLTGFLLDAIFDASLDGVPGVVASVVLLGWAGLYVAVGTTVAGRTVGKAMVGLKVVSGAGRPVRPAAAVVRVCAFPLSTLLFGLGLVLVVLRRDHRALHDLVARTAVVYDWGDRQAQLPGPLAAYLRAHDAA